MFQIIRDIKSIMTPEEFRSEILGGIFFLIGFPIVFAGLWIISPA